MTPAASSVPRSVIRVAVLLTFCLAAIVGWLTLSPIGARPPRIQHLDKAAHFLAFAALALPLASVLTTRTTLWAVIGLAILYGGAIELVQPYVGRGAEWADFIADALGALAGAALGRRLRPHLLARLGAPVSPGAGGSAGSSRSPSSAGLR